MKLINNIDDFFSEVENLIRNAEHFCYISTFGLYLNITAEGKDTTQWGDKYTNRQRKLVDIARAKQLDVRIINGVAERFQPEGGCRACQQMTDKKWKVARNHEQLLPGVQVRNTNNHHTKMIITDQGAIIGGRNFVDSDWNDISILINGWTIRYDLYEEFMRLWKLHEPEPVAVNPDDPLNIL